MKDILREFHLQPIEKQYKKIISVFRKIERKLLQNQAIEKETSYIRLLMSHCSDTKIRNKVDKIDQNISLENLLDMFIPLEQKLNRSVYDHDIIVTKDDMVSKSRDILPVSVILYNLRSAFNVGSIIRTSECLNIDKVYLAGYTATPAHIKVQKTAMGTQEYINWEYHKDIEALLAFIEQLEAPVFALETVRNAHSIYDFRFPKPSALLLGNEALGLPEKILRKCSDIVYIPTRGWKNSLNVSNAFAIAAYELYRQWSLQL